MSVFVCVCVCLCVSRWLRCLHCSLTARRSWVLFPHGLSPGPFCVEFACSQGVSSTKNPHRKNIEQNTLRRSLTKTDVSPHLVPGRLKKKDCQLLLGSWRKDSPGWDKCRS